ncbi:protein phosphatase 1 regulatory subunit 16A-like isoform X2 [Lineus longissimus]|uniref:protein phosphatase 1 regulatory subunit 16A-like isoform X2 n=1 Tax=Lineus longissimus TaxID=88925 RepID=UPI00315CF3DD
MDHNELMAELPLMEKMSTQERLKLAKKRRSQQLKRWGQYEKALEKETVKKRKSSQSNNFVKKPKKTGNKGHIQFIANIMLLEAASRNDIEEVQHLLNANVSPDVTNEDGLTALHQCCIDDNENMMQLLIEFGANVNAQDSELWTPLHAAATCGHVHLCKYLIEKGADLLAVNADGNMPYDICEDELTLDFIESEMAKKGITQELIDDTRISVEKNMLQDVQKLHKEGRDLIFVDRNGATPLHIAAANGYVEVTKFLLQHNVPIDARDNDSWQPIHAAACWGQPLILELLVQHGADVDAKTKNGETCLDICEDLELRQRILDIKDEIANHRIHAKTSLTRTRSQNTRRFMSVDTPSHTRAKIPESWKNQSHQYSSTGSLYSSNLSIDKSVHSASIRRSSMREKSMISWKEAREEAKLRESITDEEDVRVAAPKGERKPPPAVNGVKDSEAEKGDVPVKTRKKENKENIPATNIDDIKVSVHVEEAKSDKPDHRTVKPVPETVPEETTPPSEKKPDTSLSLDVADSGPIRKYSSEERLARGSQSHGQRSSPRSDEESVQMFQMGERRGSMDLKTGGTPAAGTLSDLKRARSLEHQNAKMKRSRENITDSSRSSNVSVDRVSNGSNGTTPLLENNNKTGHMQPNSVSPTPHHIPPSPAYGDPPLRKFKAQNTEIVGGDESKQRCCTIM